MTNAAYTGPSCDLAPDPDTISKFVAWWFHHCMKGRIEVGWMDGKWGGLTHFRQFDIGDDDLVDAVVEANRVPGQSIYVRASTVARRDVFSKEAGYTTDEDFIQAPGPWGDLDTAEQVERARTVQSIIRPNGSVITGRVPHMRVQPYFRTEDPISDPALVRSLNRRVLALYRGDPAVVNPTRLMRLPGTIAWPWKANRVPELTSFALPTDNRLASYPVEMLLAQLPQEPTEKQDGAKQENAEGAQGLNRVSDLMRAIKAGREWHNNMLRLTAHWIGRGWSDAEILTACEALTLSGYTVKQTRDEVLKMVLSGRARWGVEDDDQIIGEAPSTPFSGGIADPWDTLAPPAFPIHALPRALREFVEVRARVMGADPCALAWSCLSACSAAIPGSVRLQVKRHEQWAVPPSLWVALIGASSAKKSPAISAAWQPLERAQAADIREYADAVKRWKAIPKKERDDAPEPMPPRRLITHDATMESLQEMLSHQNRGVGVLRDELSGFIAGMDKYTAGKGGSERAFFLQSYNGGAYVSDRVGRGTTAIDNLLVTVCGGIQPDRLAQFSDLADDGLWQRFVPIIVAKQDEMDTDEPTGPEADAYASVMERLLAVPSGTRASFSEAAHAVRERVARDIFELEQKEPMNGHFTSFIGKLLGMWARLALVLSQIEPHPVASHIVHEAHADAARVLIQHCAIPHAARVYLTMGEGAGNQQATKAIAGFILAKKLTRILSSDLTRRVRACRGHTVQEIQQMTSPLVAAGWLSPEREGSGNHGWLVNAKVHEKFAERAIIESRRRAEVHAIITGEEEDGYDD